MKTSKKKAIIVVSVIMCIVAITMYALLSTRKSTDQSGLSAELLRAREYGEVEEKDAKVDGCDGLSFSAFFTRDLNNDGNAEKVKGTCKEIGQKDTLYVDLNVSTDCSLKDAKITLDAKNFTWTTAIVADNSFIKEDCIGNTTEIKLNDEIKSGSQRTLWGTIDSNITNNIKDYTQDSTVTLTGTYVKENGNGTSEEKTFTKEVKVTVDWYGATKTEVNKYYYNNNNYTSYRNQKYDIDTLVDGDNVKVKFQVAVAEVSRQLILEEQKVDITIPQLNGKDAIDAKSTDGNVDSNYNKETGILTVTRKAVKDENGKVTSTIARSNLNNIEVTYPLEAYTSTSFNSISLNVPVKAYNSGYNNEHGFDNPYKSEAEGIIALAYSKVEGDVWNAYTYVGDKVYDSATRQYKYEVSKEAPTNIYNGNVYADDDDEYTVEWQLATGEYGDQVNGFTLEEAEKNGTDSSDKFLNTSSQYDSMNGYIKTTGIYFSNASNFLGNDGWIELYTEDGQSPIEKFTAENWNKYSKTSPFEVNLDKIKIKTSKPQNNQVFSVYQIKEIDDSKLTEHYEKTQFEKLSYIYTYLKATATMPEVDKETTQGQPEASDDVVAVAESTTVDNSKITSEIYVSSFAGYDVPYSVQRLSVSPSQITNQKTEDIKFTISTISTNLLEKKWTNGVFLLELPEKILNLTVSKVTPSSESVKIKSYSTYEENGRYYIKISTENDEETLYSIDVEASITANPLETTHSSEIKLYAYNKNCDNYKENAEDVYDIDNDGHKNDYVGSTSNQISIIAPSGLLTTEYVTNYDGNEESMVVAPNVADIEKADGERTATINVSITNNYNGTISDMVILGKIPYKDNKYTIAGRTLNSNFTANIMGEISIPQGLEGKVTVYYSTNENATKELDDEGNGWESDTNKVNWENVKNYLICFNDYLFKENEKYIFSYNVKIPNDLNYNDASFSHHAVYYNLDTENGKLAVKTEPNKVGIQIVSKYNFKLTKTKKAHSGVFVAGATYSVTTKDVDGNPIVKSATTNENGVLQLSGLYLGREYTVKELSSTDDYVVSDKEIKFTTKIGEDGHIKVEVNEENSDRVEYNEENNIVEVNVENEAKYTLVINKTDDENQPLSGVRFLLKGKGKNVSVKTNEEGQLMVTGLYPNEKYQLQETKAEGYYVDQKAREFSVTMDEHGALKIEPENALENAEIKEEEGKTQATLTLHIKNEKIPTFDLKIVKVEIDNKGKELTELKKLENAKFIIEGSDDDSQKEYTTNNEGEITLCNLYAHEEGKYIEGKYTIQETKAPSGYSNNGEKIQLQVSKKDSGLEAKVDNQDGLQTFREVKVEDNTVIIVIQDVPLFKLTKIDSATEKPLANAKFVIYQLNEEGHELGYAKDINNNYVGVQNEYGQYVVTTGEDGSILLPLKPGYYKAVEIGYPEGYQENSNEEFFKIEGDEEEDDEDVENPETPEVEGKEVTISSEEELLEFSKCVNSDNEEERNKYNGKTIILEKDLDLSGKEFTPIGKDEAHYFSGTFDGDGYEITNLNIESKENGGYIDGKYVYCYVGLFGYINEGKIKNLGVSGNVSGGACTYVGGIVGYANNVSISNCHNACEITTNFGETFLGGIVGMCDCTSISDCYNIGRISNGYNNTTTRHKSGGIVAVANDSTMSNCYNTGEIDNGNINSQGGDNAGGIGGITENCIIKNSYNSGRICNNYDSGMAGFNCVGGIIGYTYSGSSVSNCYNTGIINQNYMRGSQGYEGGIVGQGGSISNCFNTGDVTSSAVNSSSGSTSYVYVGGISGYGSNISNCYNTGEVDHSITSMGIAAIYTGGISGYGGSINNCYNDGDVSCSVSDFKWYASDVYTGGIEGSGNSISNCYVTANVSESITGSGSSVYNVYAGQIVASGGSGIINCYYCEDIIVSGTNQNLGGESKDDNYMRTEDFCEDLNGDKEGGHGVWGYRPNRYPVLSGSIPQDIVEGTELNIQNTIKKFKITTKVKNNEGGSITGNDQNPFKTVVYDGNYDKGHEGQDGYDTFEDILMTPNSNYDIVSVTINGEEVEYEVYENGKYKVPESYFEHMKEDKEVVVTYAPKNEILTIKKVDEGNNTPLAGAKFKIESSTSTSGSSSGTETQEPKLYTTNKYGEVRVNLTAGTYIVTEVEAPEGYTLSTETQTVTID